jgi:uncharacterized protein DUF3800
MPLFAFLDESGHYHYTHEHGNYLVFAAVITADPMLFTTEFAALKYELLAQGQCLPRFHACEDAQAVRNRVFALLAASPHYAVHSIIVRKNRVNPSLYKYGVYSIAYRTMLKYLIWKRQIDRVHIIVDMVPDKSQQVALKENLKKRADEVLVPAGIPFTIDHHDSTAHALLQAADYCAWAIYKKWHSKDVRSYEHIKARIRNEFDLYAQGDQVYY